MSKFKPISGDPRDNREPIRESRESKKSVPRYETVLYSGERLPKSDKIFASLGTVEELLAYLGIIKAQHYSSSDNSAKMFMFARFTQIQESLLAIMYSLGTSKKVLSSRFSDAEQRTRELELEIEKFSNRVKMYDHPLAFIPGQTVLEANLFYARALCRRAERQICASKNLQIGVVPEDNILNYLNRLGDYFLCLAINK
jgi:cob(I)alamin adenosyltransferase